MNKLIPKYRSINQNPSPIVPPSNNWASLCKIWSASAFITVSLCAQTIWLISLKSLSPGVSSDDAALFVFLLLLFFWLFACLFCVVVQVMRFCEWWRALVFNELFICCLLAGSVWCAWNDSSRGKAGVKPPLVTFLLRLVRAAHTPL